MDAAASHMKESEEDVMPFNGSSLMAHEEVVIICFLEKEETILCNGTPYDPVEHRLTPHTPEFWMYLVVYCFLVCFAGTMAGLVQAIMAIDSTSLKVLIAGGTPENKKFATRIEPFVRRHHQVLVTLVLANAVAVESMPIFLDRISDPVTAILVSCTAVLIFGELVWTLICSFYPIAWPFGKLIDFILGRDHGTYYHRNELSALIDIHKIDPCAGENGKKSGDKIWSMGKGQKEPPDEPTRPLEEKTTERLSNDEVTIIKGALDMSSKTARDAMTPLADVYMLSIDSILDEKLVEEILDMGHSRVPVYGSSRGDVLGVFITKRLIAINPGENTPLKSLVKETGCRKAFFPTFCVDQNISLYEILNRFQVGIMTHMAFVTAEKAETDTQEFIGIVTMEDVIEQLLQEKIYDEADVSRNHGTCMQLAKALRGRKNTIAVTDPILLQVSELQNDIRNRRVSDPVMSMNHGQQSNLPGNMPKIEEVVEETPAADGCNAAMSMSKD